MPDEQTKSWFKGGVAVAFTVIKGFAIPLSLGIIGYALAWPLGYVSCTKYGEGIGQQTKWLWWNCYVEHDGKYLLKQEYQSSVVGIRLVVQPEIKLP